MNKIEVRPGVHVLVDDDDFEVVSKYKWHLSFQADGAFYCRRWDRSIGKNVRLHRQIIGATAEQIVDHINGDTLDNRKQNLRIATPLQNARNKRIAKNNTSGYRGVEWMPARKKWRAVIRVEGKRRSLGCYTDILAAAAAYDSAARNIFGDFYRPNQSPQTIARVLVPDPPQ